MAVDKVVGISYSALSKVLGIAKASISKILGETAAAGGGDGDITVSFYSGDFDIKEDTDNTAITSLTAGDDLSDDPRFYIQYGTGPTTLDKTGESQNSTLAIGTVENLWESDLRLTWVEPVAPSRLTAYN